MKRSCLLSDTGLIRKHLTVAIIVVIAKFCKCILNFFIYFLQFSLEQRKYNQFIKFF